LLDRIDEIEADIRAVHGSMLEVTWDGREGAVCLQLGGKRIASAATISGLAHALEQWAIATGLSRAAKRIVVRFDYSSEHLDELFASRAF
jgi:hypothetical protein